MRIITRLTISGPTLHTLLLTQKINDNNNQSILVTGVVEDDEKTYQGATEKYGVKPLVIDELKRTPGFIEDLFVLTKLLKIINKCKPDVVHTHHAKAGTIGRIAAKILGVRVRIHTFHGHVLSGYFSKNVSRIIIFVEKLLAKLSTSIITISQEQYNDIVSNFRITHTHKTEVIPLGFDFKKMVNPSHPKGYWRGKLGVSDSTVCIGFVGRLAPIKNISLLVSAFADYVKLNDNSSLWIIGDGPDRQLLEATISRNKLNGKIKLLGWQTDLSELYQDIDVLALTSINEGTPVAIIEALAHGVPVVSTNVGGVKSILTLPEMGRVVDGFDSLIFAQSIADVVKQSIKKNANNEEWYREMYNKYSSDRLVSDIENLYRSLL